MSNRSHAITTTAAVVASCDVCGKRSDPLDPERVAAWAERHAQLHEDEGTRERAEALGHHIRALTTWMIEDDSEGHAECSCGWRSRDSKACWAPRYALDHAREVVAVAEGGAA